MFEQLTDSVRRLAGGSTANDAVSAAPLVGLGDSPENAVHSVQTDLGALRGVTPAAADQAPCVCPEPCERDHANE